MNVENVIEVDTFNGIVQKIRGETRRRRRAFYERIMREQGRYSTSPPKAPEPKEPEEDKKPKAKKSARRKTLVEKATDAVNKVRNPRRQKDKEKKSGKLKDIL
jgi:hypothetical protein